MGKNKTIHQGKVNKDLDADRPDVRQVNLSVRGELLDWLMSISEERGGVRFQPIIIEKLNRVMRLESTTTEA
jgi:hypothetical protein